MRFYNSDGSIKLNSENDNFGWNLACRSKLNEDANRTEPETAAEEIEANKIDEKEPQLDHRRTIIDDNSKKKKCEDQAADSISPTKCCETKQTDDDARNHDTIDHSRCEYLEMRHKEDLTDFLMRFGNVESLLLVSIVNSGLFKILTDSRTFDQNLSDEVDASRHSIAFRRRRRLEKLSSVFDHELSEHLTDDDCPSLLSELAECDVTSFDDSTRPTSVGGAASPGDSRCEIFKRVGLDGDIDKTLRKFFDETCEMHGEVEDIGKCFREMDDKIGQVEEKASKFRSEMYETQFLDDVLSLLEGKFEKVGRPLPFKNVGRKAPQAEEINLIV